MVTGGQDGEDAMSIDENDPSEVSEVAELSDADSEQMRMRNRIRQLDRAKRDFLKKHFPESQQLIAEASRKSSRKKGPRKARELPTEIKMLLTEATNAWTENRYDDALIASKEIIRLNAEVPAAWGMIATVYEEQGGLRYALEAKRIHASLEKNSELWLAAADLAIRVSEDDPLDGMLRIALECYGEVLKADRSRTTADRNNVADRVIVAARLGRANVLADLGQSSKAVEAYQRYLALRPFSLHAVRNLAEHAFNARRREEAIQVAIDAYTKCADHARAGGALDDDVVFEWIDVSISIELFASLQLYREASSWLARQARWLLGRANESIWDEYDDDREWDLDDTRRREHPGFHSGEYAHDSYGLGLPPDLRAKLAIYRLQMNMEDEAMTHLQWLSPDSAETLETLGATPLIVKEIADQLYESGKLDMAMAYYTLYGSLEQTENLYADYFVSRAKCHLKLNDMSAAEEDFIQALEVEPKNVEALYELAAMYEAAEERDAAFRLVGEALSLGADQSERRRDPETHRLVMHYRGKLMYKPRKYRRTAQDGDGPTPSSRGKYRPRRLGGEAVRRKFEEEMTARLKERYAVCQRLKVEMAAGHQDESVVAEWMAAAKELVDDFRSFRDFYSWEKWVSSLGYGNLLTAATGTEAGHRGGIQTDTTTTGSIANLAKRLHSTLAPAEPDAEGAKPPQLQRHEHRGIPFNDWLDLFLEYAVSLARDQQVGEAYAVCQSARDSIVYNKAKDSMFLIHLAWASCAVMVGDEETCVAIARYFMAQETFTTDAYNMFAALCRACQTSSSWYSSGPSQKFMLRQIRQLDSHLADVQEAARRRGEGAAAGKDKGGGDASGRGREEPMMLAQTGTALEEESASSPSAQLYQEAQARERETATPIPTPTPTPTSVDVCLLVIYGCMLFSSTSYQYALAYFLRAASLDPSNPIINLVVALAYIHWSLKRQSANRQYALMQGISYLFRYHDDRASSQTPEERQEGHFNVARCYHLLGVHDLAMEYYRRVLLEERAVKEAVAARIVAEGRRRPVGGESLVLEAAMNMRVYCLTTGDLEGARAITEEWLVL